MENKLHQNPAETAETTTTTTTRLDYEFTKYFLKSCLNEFKKLDGPSKVGKFIGDSIDIASGVTTAISGEKAGRAVELSNTVVTPFDRIAQKKKKIHVISIISSNSSQTFHKEFCHLFIGLGVRAYLAYEVLLQNIFLKAGSGDTKKEDPLQAVQILGGFAGSRCFDHMVNTGTKENLLEALTTKDTFLECLSKFKSLCVEKLYYWTNKVTKKTKNSNNSNGELLFEREQKCISSYDFFFKTIPVFIHVENSCDILRTKSCNNVKLELEQREDIKLYIFRSDMSKSKKQRLRKPLDFEIKAQHSQYANLVLIPSKMVKAYAEFILPVKLEDFILHQNPLQLTEEIARKLKDDESLSWNDTTLDCLRGVRDIVEDIHRKISEHSSSFGFEGNEKASSNHLPKVRFNVRDPIESFTGREVYLKDLHKTIKDSPKAGSAMTVTVLSQTSVISGLGGIGKTETVRMYIHKYGTEYDHIVWIDAELHSTAEACFQKLAIDKLMIKSQNHENKPKHFETILDEIYHLLCQNGSILLLVFDNAEALYDNFEGEGSQNNGPRSRSRTEGIQRFLPASLPPHLTKPSILITSRLQDWGQQNVIQLGLWTEAECTAFIRKQLQLEDTDGNSAESLVELSQFFDRFPMALQAAVGVIRQQAKRQKLVGGSYRIRDLINDYGNGKRDVLKRQPLDSSSNKTTMFLIWNVTLDKIRGEGAPGELAIKILNTMAYLSPTVIPKCLICHLFKEEEALADALELLSDYSLIEASKDQFTIHRMIQDVTMEQLRATDAAAAAHIDNNGNGPRHSLKEMEILLRLTQEFKEYLPSFLKSDPTYDYILTNMIHVADIVSTFISKEPVPPVVVAVVVVEDFQRFVEYLADQIKKTRSDLAQKYYEILIQSSSSCVVHFDEDMQKVRQAYQLKLAGILRWQGKYSQAQDKLAQILEEQEETWGLEDPATLTTRHKIAYVLSDQGKFREALEMYKAVLSTREKNSGTASSDAPYCYDNDTFKTKHNMALVLNNLGDYQNALTIFTEVLEVRTRELGENKYDTLKTKRDMAGVLNNIGEYEDAIRMYSKVENRWEKELGLTNPDVIKTKHNKALVLLNQEKYEDALQTFLQVFEIRKQDLGLCHPETLKTKECLADVLRRQGKRDEALKLYSEVLKIRKDLLGSSHPHTLTTKQSVDDLQCKYWL